MTNTDAHLKLKLFVIRRYIFTRRRERTSSEVVNRREFKMVPDVAFCVATQHRLYTILRRLSNGSFAFVTRPILSLSTKN